MGIVFSIALLALTPAAAGGRQRLVVKPSEVALDGVPRCSVRRLVLSLHNVEGETGSGEDLDPLADKAPEGGRPGLDLIVKADSEWLVVSDLTRRVRLQDGAAASVTVYVQPLARMPHASGRVVFLDRSTAEELASVRIELTLAPEQLDRGGPQPDAPPALVITPIELDLGDLVVGDVLEVPLVLENHSAITVEIAGTSAGCQTRLTGVIPHEVAAGETRPVRVAISAGEVLGPFEDGLVIETREPFERSYWIPIRGIVHPSGLIVDGQALEGTRVVPPGGRIGTFVVVWPQPQGHGDVACATSSSSIRLIDEVRQEGLYRWLDVSVEAVADLAPRRYDEEVTIISEGAVLGRIPVSFDVVAQVRITPAVARLGLVSAGIDGSGGELGAGETGVADCRVLGEDVRSVEIESIDVASGPRPDVRVEHREDGWHVCLALSGGREDRGEWGGLCMGWVTLMCSPGGARRLPWRGFVVGCSKHSASADAR